VKDRAAALLRCWRRRSGRWSVNVHSRARRDGVETVHGATDGTRDGRCTEALEREVRAAVAQASSQPSARAAHSTCRRRWPSGAAVSSVSWSSGATHNSKMTIFCVCWGSLWLWSLAPCTAVSLWSLAPCTAVRARARHACARAGAGPVLAWDAVRSALLVSGVWPWRLARVRVRACVSRQRACVRVGDSRRGR
jgi:hypothetical protein